MEKNKKYLALIMNRIYSKNGNFIYVVSHPEIGLLDEKTNTFTDRNGNEYFSMFDELLTMSEVTDAFYGIIPLDKIIEETGEKTVSDGITKYVKKSNEFIYYVSSIPGEIIFVSPISLVDMKESIDSVYKIMSGAMQENNNLNGVSNISYAEDEYDDNSDEDDEIYNITKEIINGTYSLDELKELKSLFSEKRDDIDGLLESLDLQIESMNPSEKEKNIKDVKTKNTTTSSLKRYNMIEMYDKIRRTLIAQDEPLKRVITEIIRKEENSNGRKRGLLITGATGVGKTKMMSLIAENMDKVFFKIDSTQLTIPGYVGRSIEEYLWDLYIKCGKDMKKVENAIIFFDEIDKKGSSRKEDISGRGVLNTLLPFIEGEEYNACDDVRTKDRNVKINTGNMTVIFGGAFTDVYRNLSRNDCVIGFGKDVDQNKKERPASVDDFIEKAKIPDEFMGRVSIIKLNDLDIDAIKRILLESDESAIKIQQDLFKKLGVKLTVGDDYIDEVAKRAFERRTGARGLNSVVDETTWVAYADAYSNIGNCSEIILGKDTVDNPKVYKKI